MKALRLLGRIGAFVGAFIALFVLMTAPLVWIIGESNTTVLETVSDATAALAVVLAGWLCARFLDHRRLNEIGFSPRAFVWLILGGIFLGALMSAGALAALTIKGGWSAAEGSRISNSVLAAVTIGGMLVNVTFQEGLARGYIFDIAHRTFGGAAAVIVSAAFFVGLHSAIYLAPPGLPFIAANLSLAGVALGLSVLWTGSIWFAVGMHFAWNFIESFVYGRDAGVALFAGFDGRWVHLTSGSMEATPIGLVGPALGIFFLCAWRLLRGRPRLITPRATLQRRDA